MLSWLGVGSLERREREKQELRARILEAARELFLAHGYDAVTMRKIAERIEYSPTAIYLHFKDKPALIHELVSGDFRALAAQFQRIARVGDPVERLRQTGRAYIDFGLAHPSTYRTMFSAPPPSKSTKEEAHRGNPDSDGYAFMRGIVAEAVSSGRLRPELTDVELVAQVCWASVHGVVSLLVARGEDDWLDWRKHADIADTMLDVLVRGLCRGEQQAAPPRSPATPRASPRKKRTR